MVCQDTIHIKTAGHRDMHDITAQVAEIVTRSKISTGREIIVTVQGE